MKIIAFVGMPASGKGEAALVARLMGYPVITMGDIIREEVRRSGLEPSDENLGATGTRLRLEEGPAAIARRCVPKFHSLDADTAIVDGVRNIEEVELFKQEFGNDVFLINIEAMDENRISRIRNRGRTDDNFMDREALRIRDERELEWGMGESMRKADLTVDNNGTVEEFRGKIKKIIEELT